MAVELFNINYYIAEASVSNPDQASFLTHTTGYALNSAPTDRIFVQSTGRVTITGGTVHPTAVSKVSFCVLDGPSPDRNVLVVPGIRLFAVRGGNGLTQAKVFSQNVSLYEITS